VIAINKQQIFDFFKAENIVKEIKDNIKIFEENNKNKSNVLKEVNMVGFLPNKRYFEIDPENPTFIKPNKPTERVIIEDNDQYMNVVAIEMKPIKSKGIIRKLERTFSWLYLLFNLLEGKENKQIRLFFVLCKYSNKKMNNVTCKSYIDIFHNLRIKYIKKIYYSNGKEKIILNWQDIIDKSQIIGTCNE